MTTTTTHRTGGSRGANGYGEYQVRYASEKQKLFINSLLDTKEHSLGVIDIEKLNVQGATDLIKQLLALPNKEGKVILATEKQISFAQSLVLKKALGLHFLNVALADEKVHTLEELSKKRVSELINALRLTKDKELPITITEVGAYLLNSEVCSIRQSNSTKRWQVWSYNKIEHRYMREPDYKKENTILTSLAPTNRLTLELAIKYSAHTGLCVHCGRTLTLLKSVAGGMGAWCAKKYR